MCFGGILLIWLVFIIGLVLFYFGYFCGNVRKFVYDRLIMRVLNVWFGLGGINVVSMWCGKRCVKVVGVVGWLVVNYVRELRYIWDVVLWVVVLWDISWKCFEVDKLFWNYVKVSYLVVGMLWFWFSVCEVMIVRFGVYLRFVIC